MGEKFGLFGICSNDSKAQSEIWSVEVNGESVEALIPSNAILLDVLRIKLELLA